MKLIESILGNIELTGETGTWRISASSEIPEVGLELIRLKLSAPEAAALPQVRLLRGDVRDFPLAEAACDLIWHGAAPAVLGLPPGEMTSIVEDGTRRVLELAPEHVPVWAGLPFGHRGRNLPLPIGMTARMDAASGRLALEA